jgi:hypothetical protein
MADSPIYVRSLPLAGNAGSPIQAKQSSLRPASRSQEPLPPSVIPGSFEHLLSESVTRVFGTLSESVERIVKSLHGALHQEVISLSSGVSGLTVAMDRHLEGLNKIEGTFHTTNNLLSDLHPALNGLVTPLEELKNSIASLTASLSSCDGGNTLFQMFLSRVSDTSTRALKDLTSQPASEDEKAFRSHLLQFLYVVSVWARAGGENTKSK